MGKEMKDLTEEDFKKAEKMLREKDPLYDAKVEFGTLLMQPIECLTEAQKKRYDELKTLIEASDKWFLS